MNVSATFVDSILTPKQVLPLLIISRSSPSLSLKTNGRKAKFLNTLLAGAQYSHLVDLTIYSLILIFCPSQLNISEVKKIVTVVLKRKP